MSHYPPLHPAGVDVSAGPAVRPYVALLLGVLSVPGSILTWDTSLPGKGLVWGLPAAVVAVVVGIAALRSRSGPRWASVVGIVLGGAMIAMTAVWMLASAG